MLSGRRSRGEIGCAPEQPRLYVGWTAREFGELSARLHEFDAERASAALKRELAVEALVDAFLAVPESHCAMLADDAYRVLAIRPRPIGQLSGVESSWLPASGGRRTLILCAPAWLVISVFVGIPAIIGAVFLAVAVAGTIAAYVAVTVLFTRWARPGSWSFAWRLAANLALSEASTRFLARPAGRL